MSEPETGLTAAPAEDYDAHETLKPHEPPFTIQGGDPLGPKVVQYWADEARKLARDILNGVRAGFEPEHEGEEYTPTSQDMLDADALLRKATKAETVVWEMQAYQRGDVAVAETRATYSEAEVSDGTDRLQLRKALIRSAGNLQNARAIAKEVEERLAGFGIHLEEQVAILTAVESLGQVAEAIDPRKGGERT